MKVLMTADAVGGVFSYAVELVRALAPAGVEFHLVTTGAALRPDQRRVLSALPLAELHETRFRLEWMQDPWDDVDACAGMLLDLSRRLKPDLVHLNEYAHGALPWGAPAIVVGHSCVLSWWQAVKHDPAPASWNRYRITVARGLRGAARVIAPSAAMLRALQRHYGPLPRTHVIKNGVDGGRFVPAPKRELILSAGRLWDEAKNVAALEAVAAELPWPVFVAGELAHPGGGADVHTGARHLGKLGPEELARWYGRAAIYALPARYEPFGLSVLEAALSGCALVLGDVDSLRETWAGVAAFVPPDDHGALRDALAALIRDGRQREELGRLARERALALDPGRMARAYLRVYRELTGEPLQEEISCAS
jgi:glycogen(starch) synthase